MVPMRSVRATGRCLGNAEMAVTPFVIEPGCVPDLLADAVDSLTVGLDVPFKRVQRLLEFVHQFAGKVVFTRRKTGCFQISDPANLISTCFHCNNRKVPPRSLCLDLVLLLVD